MHNRWSAVRSVLLPLTLVVVAALGVAAQAAAQEQMVPMSPAGDSPSRVEQGQIVGWPGGDAVIYPTLGFFGNAQIFAVGAVAPDGSFRVELPPSVPMDLLGKSSEQCSTIRSSDPDAMSNFTGNYLIFQHGKPTGATHSASSLAFASFTGFGDGDTRTGFFYTDRDVTLGGFCDRQLSFGTASIDFLQNFDITAHKGWNEVVAAISVPQPGHVVATLRTGSNVANEQWFFFPASPMDMASHG